MFTLKKSTLIITSLLFSLMWSLCLFQYWSTDFGFYYLISNSLSDNNILYKNIFDHKGPIYYIFIKSISYFIGYGIYQSYFILSITVFLFVLTLILISKNNNFIYSIILLLITFSLLHTQNLNVSIQLFQSTFIILSFFFLYKFLGINTILSLHLSYLFIIFAIFIRIDSIIYLPVYLISSLIVFKKNYIKVILNNIFLIIYFIFFYFLMSNYFNFSIDDYFVTNFSFNLSHSWAALREPFIRIFNSPAHIYFLLFTGLLYLSLEITNIIIKSRLLSLKSLILRKNLDLLISLIIFFIGALFWLYTGSDKNYHVFILITPMLFLVTNYYNLLSLSKIKIYFFISVGFFFTLITIYPEQKNVLMNKCIFDYKKCINLSNIQTTIESTRDFDNPIFIGGNSWIFIINKKTIDYSINNYPFYTVQIKNGKSKDIFFRDHFLETHKSILNKPEGYIFWIKKNIYNLDSKNKYFRKSKYLDELIKNSSIVEDQGDFFKLKIVK